MAIPYPIAKFTAHFHCTKCNLNYRQERNHFLTQECCPICSKINCATSWSFTARNMAQPSLHEAIDQLSQDVAYDIHQKQVLFPEPKRPDIPIIEIDADHFLSTPKMVILCLEEGGNHE